MSEDIDYSDIPETNEEFWEEAEVEQKVQLDAQIKQDVMTFIDIALTNKEENEPFLSAMVLRIEKGLKNNG